MGLKRCRFEGFVEVHSVSFLPLLSLNEGIGILVSGAETLKSFACEGRREEKRRVALLPAWTLFFFLRNQLGALDTSNIQFSSLKIYNFFV